MLYVDDKINIVYNIHILGDVGQQKRTRGVILCSTR